MIDPRVQRTEALTVPASSASPDYAMQMKKAATSMLLDIAAAGDLRSIFLILRVLGLASSTRLIGVACPDARIGGSHLFCHLSGSGACNHY
jgi:hypothetical protein